MRKTGLVLLTMVVAALLIACYAWGRVGMAGLHLWDAFMQGLISFRLPLFAGFVILLILIYLKTDNTDHHDHHDNNNGGQRRLEPVRVKSTYRDRY